MNKTLRLIMCLTFTLSVGFLGGIATANSVKDWYVTLNKPIFNPPNYLFGPVWTLLYILMGVSFYLLLQEEKSNKRSIALIIFYLQLFLNFCWSFIFFNFHMLGFAFFEIILLWLTIVLMIVSFRKLNKISAYLQIPYLLWVSFASILNGSIWLLN